MSFICKVNARYQIEAGSLVEFPGNKKNKDWAEFLAQIHKYQQGLKPKDFGIQDRDDLQLALKNEKRTVEELFKDRVRISEETEN